MVPEGTSRRYTFGYDSAIFLCGRCATVGASVFCKEYLDFEVERYAAEKLENARSLGD